MTRLSTSRLLALTFLALCLVLLWDASGLDLPFARLAGTPHGFPWRDRALFVLFMHEGPRFLSWIFVAGLFAAIRWPVGVFRRLDMAERAQLAVTVLASVIAISLVKSASATSCPWDLAEFGGVARHVSHWAWGVADGGPGRCFPAGHASAAFAYVGGWFVLRRHVPGVARVWLAIAILAGLALGLGQQWRGAHYMSHTLWTAWICWFVGLAIDLVCQAIRQMRQMRQRRAAVPAAASFGR